MKIKGKIKIQNNDLLNPICSIQSNAESMGLKTLKKGDVLQIEIWDSFKLESILSKPSLLLMPHVSLLESAEVIIENDFVLFDFKLRMTRIKLYAFVLNLILFIIFLNVPVAPIFILIVGANASFVLLLFMWVQHYKSKLMQDLVVKN